MEDPELNNDNDKSIPVWITPLRTYQKEEPKEGHYEVLTKLVTVSPVSFLNAAEATSTDTKTTKNNNAAEIETALEIFISPEGLPLWRRVVVRSGPCCPNQTIHASYMLPDDTNAALQSPSDSVLCWASFPHQATDGECLCVLATPTLLCIWDVYSKGEQDGEESMGEGHTIPLPFEASGIFPLGRNAGLLIQRRETMEDLQQIQENKSFQSSSKFGFGEAEAEEEDGFLLKAPPRPVRLSTGASSVGGSLNNVSTAAGAGPTSGGSGVPSLFTLSHPLDDVLPVYTFPQQEEGDLNNHIPGGIVTDVFEKVLFVGVMRWIDTTESNYLNRKEQEQPICVTYHTHRKRHAIWEIKESPPPPEKAPLWQTSRQWRSDNGWNSHLGVLQQDLEDMELVGSMPPPSSDLNSSHYDSTARTEALADALGVRKTPRKAVDDMAPRNRAAGMSIGRSTNRNRGGGGKSNSNNNNLNVSHSLLSPTMSMRHPNESHTVESMMDMSLESTTGGRPPLLNTGPFSSLHPKFAVTCLYDDQEMTTLADEIFLVSNIEGSGTLALALVCPGKDARNPNDIRLFSFEPTSAVNSKNGSSQAAADDSSFSKQFTVKVENPIPCIAAKPINAFQVPNCFVPHQRNGQGSWNGYTTDILLLRMQKNFQMGLSLFRNIMHLVECALLEGLSPDAETACTSATIRDVEFSAGDKIDIVYEKESGEEICVRGRLPLNTTSSLYGDRVVQAIESMLISPPDCSQSTSLLRDVELALKIRIDCTRLEQALVDQKNDRFSFGDGESTAVSTVILAIFSALMQKSNANKENESGSTQRPHESTSWDKLLESSFHRDFLSRGELDFGTMDNISSADESRESGVDSSTSILSKIGCLSTATICPGDSRLVRSLFDALHMLYEDYKLHTSSREEGMHFVGSILCRVCNILISNDTESSSVPNLYLEHYRRDMGEYSFEGLGLRSMYKGGSHFREALTNHQQPPCVMSWIDGLIIGHGKNEADSSIVDLASINATCKRTRAIVRLYGALFGETTSLSSEGQGKHKRDYDVVQTLIEEGFTEPSILRDEVPLGVAVPLLEVLQRCRSEQNMPDLEDPRILCLLGREDLRKNVQNSGRPLVTSYVPASQDSMQVMDHTNEISNIEDKDRDGICQLEITSSMLYPEDNRIREVGRLLRSSRPVYLSVTRAIEVSDHEYERLKQDKLLLLSRRVLALPIGRGMLTIGNLQPVPAEPLPLPDLCLVGRVPPTNAMLALDTSECATDLKVWPEFHNGVAAGLRLPLPEATKETISKITRTWIVYNRPPRSGQSQSTTANSPSQSLGNAHGGLLMALGLRGHLTTLEMTDIFDYLTQGSVTTTVGVLLGMAANMRGTCDISVSKMLCLHIPSLIPQHFSAIDVASTVQSAAVAGAGLLYQGSSHRMMTEFLLNEIGKRPSSDVNVLDRDAYTLSCGIALGMVNLCQGGSQNTSEGSGSAGLSDLRIDDRLYRYVVGGIDDAEMRRRREESDRLSLPSTSTAQGNEKCSCVFEGDSINTDVTAPGATLALGLIYMKSGNKTMSSAIALPDTNFLLEYVRPDFLMLRVIARALILWDEVKPTRDWVAKQIPAAVQNAYDHMRVVATRMSEEPVHSQAGDKDFDRQAVRLIYTHVVAGACFALGLRYAGTANLDAVAAILERVMELKDLRDGNDPASCALRPPVPVLEMCLGCAALSLSMVLAGTGDLDTLRLFKVLRWRCDEEINYGNHMAYGEAIGLLFLGGGTCTLGREPEDIAALLMSFYPRYPSTTSDNQYHLQALRNLYALAVKRREIRAIDVDTGESVFVPVQVHYEDKTELPLTLSSPCLLCNSDAKPREIRVASERYYPVTFSCRDTSNHIVFHVKKRSAHLSYRQDPHSQRSLMVQTSSFQAGSMQNVIESFTDDQRVLAFSRYICDAGEIQQNTSLSGPFSIPGFCRRVLHECLVLDTEEALPIYLALRSVVDSVDSGSCSPVPFVWDLRLIRSYYEQRPKLFTANSPRFLNCELVSYLVDMFENTLKKANNKSAKQDSTSLFRGSETVFYCIPSNVDQDQAMDIMDLS